jgi:hypothetical protein
MLRLYLNNRSSLTNGHSSTSRVRYLSLFLGARFLTVSRVKHESLDALEHILSHDECDVDPENSLTGKTPLHYAIELESEDRISIVESLLDAGADMR